jgi:phospholipid transport system substrate-binding protein
VIAAAMLAIGSSISPTFAAAQDPGDPKATVQTFYDALEDTMKHGSELGFDGRYKKLEPVIQQTFDVPVMAKIAVGSGWTAFSADEKNRLLDAFGRYMVTTYAARFKSYEGQQFQVGDV